MSDETLRMVEAEQAKAAFERYVWPEFDLLRSQFFDAAVELSRNPKSERDMLGWQSLSHGMLVLDKVRAQLEANVAAGKVAAAEKNRASELMKISPERRKIMGIAI